MDEFNQVWLSVLYQALPVNGRRELIAEALDIAQFYDDRINFNPPPLPDTMTLSQALEWEDVVYADLQARKQASWLAESQYHENKDTKG